MELIRSMVIFGRYISRSLGRLPIEVTWKTWNACRKFEKSVQHRARVSVNFSTVRIRILEILSHWIIPCGTFELQPTALAGDKPLLHWLPWFQKYHRHFSARVMSFHYRVALRRSVEFRHLYNFFTYSWITSFNSWNSTGTILVAKGLKLDSESENLEGVANLISVLLGSQVRYGIKFYQEASRSFSRDDGRFASVSRDGSHSSIAE